MVGLLTINGGAAALVLDLNGAEDADFPVFLEPGPGGTVEPPARNPQRTGYAFGGWFTDAACTTPFAFAEAAVTETTVIYAKWDEILWTLSFLWNDGTGGEYARHPVLDGSYPLWIPPPSRTSYGFAGWFTDAAGTTAFDFTRKAAGDQELYALWDMQHRYVHYSMNYAGGQVNPQAYAVGQNLSSGEFPVPSRAGYGFGGWYETPGCTGPAWTGGVMNQDKTVYAKWQAITYTISFFKGPSWQDQTYSVQVEHGRLLPQITPAQLT
ncbi:MAG: InlB B-repeat-containing protein, partial [Treponema sp.]|nr:InlB B-repeat-containing protein [Treponema sp.]